MLTLLLALVAAPKPPQELYNYLAKKDPTFSSKVVSEDSRGTTISLTSQTWQGIPWRHTIIMRQPSKLGTRGTGILYITGDGPRDGDYRDLALVSEATGMPVAMLFNVPNQPIWDMREDDLIAHTFEKYLETHNAEWPLLFPMTKSALRAMDAVQAATKKGPNPIKRFVVTGASKRGWTSWFVGAARDKRVIGIAPMVYDNLNVGAQMPHQIESWGRYSEMIQDYTRRGLQQKLDTPDGRHLAQIIDPFSYRANITMPTLIVRGSNDAYWTADATSLYWNGLEQPHWLLTVPNVGHDLGGGILAAATIGAFARSLAGEFNMPQVESSISPLGGPGVYLWQARTMPVKNGPQLTDARLWVAMADDLDFRPVRYERPAPATDVRLPSPPPGGRGGAFRVPTGKKAAAFIEFSLTENGRTFSLCTPTQILK